MGQGYSLMPLPAGSAGIDVPELSELAYEKSLGNARFMKTIRARHQDGLVVVKLVMKPYANMSLDTYVKALCRERRALVDVPNALGYQRILETSLNGYLSRQYVHSSLYDRMSTRPFLEDIEKKWIAFQLLCALRDCHSRDIYHGDIKTENILVTSWNWVYLTDFSSSYKPTYLPEDNPADYSFYFDISGRRTCYLAPERFYQRDEPPPETGGVNWAMDVFSAGCVIAELFLEAPIFNLSQLFKYRKREYDPEHVSLNKIEDEDIRELVLHMIKLEPESRYSADEYLNFWRRKAFPEYFYTFLHQYMGLITDSASGQVASMSGKDNSGVADYRIDREYFDFDKISYFLGYNSDADDPRNYHPNQVLTNDAVPTYIDLPHNQHMVSTDKRKAEDGTLIFLTLVASSLRNAARATAKIRACDLLLALAERLPDEAKLDRILPYIMTLLNDHSDVVRATAIRTLTQLMRMISVVSPVNAYVFSEYILPRLESWKEAGTKPKPLVRAIFASCVAPLAQSSMYFLDLVQALRANGSLPTEDPETEDGFTAESTYRDLFDVARIDLADQFEGHTKALLTDNDPFVRRAFLGSVSTLLSFFGSAKADDIILTHLNTYLNDKDWILKCAFFETIVGVAAFVGGTSLEEYILPLLLQALTDPEEFVVEKVLRSFARMAELGLFQRSRTWELMSIVNRFTAHPNIWIREAAADYVSSAAKYLTSADRYCIARPLLQPYLKTTISDFTLLSILNSLSRPFPRAALEVASLWATKVDKGVFWKPAMKHQLFSMSDVNSPLPLRGSKEITNTLLLNVGENHEDQQWVERLRKMGMARSDEWKLYALMVYIWRMSQRKPREQPNAVIERLGRTIVLQEIGVTPQTVFFDANISMIPPSRSIISDSRTRSHGPSHTITDALLDASTSIDDSIPRRTRSYINHQRKDRDRSSSIPAQTVSQGSKSEQRVPSSPAVLADTDTSSASPSDVDTHRHSTSLQKSSVTNRANGVSTRFEHTSFTSKSSSRGDRSMRHRRSGINLLNRNNISKADAEIGTTSAYVYGKVDNRRIGEHENSTVATITAQDRLDAPLKAYTTHDYSGTDPSVLTYLDSVFFETNRTDIMEFGPLVQRIAPGTVIQKPGNNSSGRPWRPDNSLVAIFGEHTGPINRVLVAPDHAFFITASDDGTVKVWDSSRLERNVTPRSRQTHRHAPGSKVKSICFVENTHSFLSAATDGSIHAVRVEFAQSKETTKYGKLGLRRDYQLPEGEYATWMEHFRDESKTTILVATNQCRVLALDLRTMAPRYTLDNPTPHGVPTCFVTDSKHTWLLLGTSHGVLDLWDLRFRLRVRSWRIPGTKTIHRLAMHPCYGDERYVCVSGSGRFSGEITVWDIEKTRCEEVYRLGSGVKNRVSIIKEYEAITVDDDRPEEMLSSLATVLEPASSPSKDGGLQAVVAVLDASDVNNKDGTENRNSNGFLLTGGTDRKLRYWDLHHGESSKIVSGLDLEELKPKFEVAMPAPHLTVVSEIPQLPPTPSSPNPNRNRNRSHRTNASNSSSRRASGRPPRLAVISQQQQQLLRNHLDAIMDVAFLRVPYGITISVDRLGMIYAFQ